VGIRLRSAQQDVARVVTPLTPEHGEISSPSKDPESWECPECHCVNFIAPPAQQGDSLCILCGFKGGPGFGCGTIFENDDDNFGLHYPHSEVSSFWGDLPKRQRRTSL
jgi:hypothetical protein